MDRAPAISSVEELLSVALDMERRAAARYAELARRMAEREHDALADLFTRLGRLERDHARFIERRLAGRLLPDPAGQASLESIVFDEASVLTPRAVLVAALRSEERAKALFERIAAAAQEAAVRRLAVEMAAEEAEHAERIAAAMQGLGD
ncbi:MAG TPA: ferritin family protein [Burkholderiales bacterium]|nr:ferritin family protein [Burkholderiales bacterium]